MGEPRTYSDEEIGKILQSWDNCRTSANPRDWYVATDIAEAIIRQLRRERDAARAENAATAAQAELAKRLLFPLYQVDASGEMSIVREHGYDAPTAGEEAQYFNQFLRESEGE